jgi:hypothetical protein
VVFRQPVPLVPAALGELRQLDRIAQRLPHRPTFDHRRQVQHREGHHRSLRFIALD